MAAHFLLGVLLVAGSTWAEASGGSTTGVRVETVEPYGAGALAGIAAGDVIAACAQGDHGWPIATPFDLTDCEWELAPRGPVTLTVIGGETTRRVEIEQGSWDLRTRPRLSAEGQRRLTVMREAMGAGDTEAGDWTALADDLAATGRVADALWLALVRVEALREIGKAALAEAEIENLLGRDDIRRRPRLALAVYEAERLLLRATAAAAERHLTNAEARVAFADRLPGRPLIGSHVRYRLALAQHYAGRSDLARTTVAVAIQRLDTEAPGPNPLRGRLLAVIGAIELAERRLDASQAATAEALRMLEAVRPADGNLAWALGNWGILQAGRKANEAAIAAYHRQAAIYDRRGEATSASQTRVNAGNAARRLGDFPRADGLLERAMQGIDADGLQAARVLGNRAYLHLSWGRLSSADAYAGRSHALFMASDVADSRLARSHARLGHIARYRGDLVTAERHYTDAMEIYREDKDDRGVRLHQNNLGNLARQRQDFATALAFYRQSLAAGTPSGVMDGRILSNIGRTLLLQGRPEAARPYLEQALSIKREDAAETLDVAASLMLLGDLERSGERWEAARTLYRQALDMHGRLVPKRPAEAENQVRLATLELNVGNWQRSVPLLSAAVATLERRAPGTDQAAAALYHLGRVRLQQGDRDAARSLLRRATDALDAQWRRLGGTPAVRLAWMHDHADVYQAYLALLVDEGRPAEAFDVLQRYRARAVRSLGGGRHLDLPRTPRAQEIEHRLTDLARRRESLLERLAATEDGADAEAALATLTAERLPLLAALRREAPNLAAVVFPAARSVDDITAALDPDEVLVSFVVGRDRSFAFALSGRSGAALRVAQIDIPHDGLRAAVEALREAILRRDSTRLEALHRQSADLYDLLLEPLAPVITEARRLTVAPDGPLHRLPFAVLRHGDRYLIEERALRITPSATALVSHGVPAVAGGGTVAFADPDYGTPDADDAAGASTTTGRLRDRRLRPLPASRVEVEAVRRTLPPPVEVLIGTAATEERAKALAGERYVHFAGHALINELAPLDSALALARPHAAGEAENGLLYAWEVLEQLRLDASLVTLSACETALGAENASAGILGFVWAFRSAGARSVMASLWSVEDRATGALMTAFYRGLAAGRDKDEALRQAQLTVLQNPRSVASEVERGVGGLTASAPRSTVHPFYWAAFQLYGAADP